MLIGIAGGIPFNVSNSLGRQIAALFAQGEKGVHFDPSDFSTLFQDSVGTTPVTAVGQVVGLMLDKSKGLVIGPELLANTGFDADTVWTKGAGWTISGGAASFNSATGATLSQTVSTNTGKAYKIEYDFTYVSGSGPVVQISSPGSTTSPSATQSSGRKSFVLIAAANYSTFAFSAVANSVFSVDNVTLKELPGYHATQATTSAKPILARHPISGRRNLLTYTEDFSNAAWVKGRVGGVEGPTVTADQAADPNGAMTADLVDYTSPNGLFVRQDWPFTAGATGTISVWAYVPAIGGAPSIRLTTNNTIAWSTGISQSYVLTTGLQRISMTGALIASGSAVRVLIGGANADGTVDASVTGKVYLFGAQLELGSTPTAYQKVTSTYDVTEAGVNDAYYLKFDGVDDFLVTPSIDFSGTDKMSVFAGCVSNSTTAAGAIAELSTNSDTSNGSWLFYADALGSKFRPVLRGTASAGYISSVANSLNSLSVLSVVYDIAGAALDAEIKPRQNGSSATFSVHTAGPAGTGNFGNYPLYIGMRAGTSLPFNGHLYSLIVRGALSDSSQISTGEVYCNSKTGAY